MQAHLTADNARRGKRPFFRRFPWSTWPLLAESINDGRQMAFCGCLIKPSRLAWISLKIRSNNGCCVLPPHAAAAEKAFITVLLAGRHPLQGLIIGKALPYDSG